MAYVDCEALELITGVEPQAIYSLHKLEEIDDKITHCKIDGLEPLYIEDMWQDYVAVYVATDCRDLSTVEGLYYVGFAVDCNVYGLDCSDCRYGFCAATIYRYTLQIVWNTGFVEVYYVTRLHVGNKIREAMRQNYTKHEHAKDIGNMFVASIVVYDNAQTYAKVVYRSEVIDDNGNELPYKFH